MASGILPIIFATFFLSLIRCGFGQALFSSSFGAPGSATFDYVVVGGGTAGLTIASRLAENGTFSVAIVEAGSFYEIGNSNRSVIPAYCTTGSGLRKSDVNPLIDWGFFTTPQPVSRADLFDVFR